jgi:hypothetical protein
LVGQKILQGCDEASDICSDIWLKLSGVPSMDHAVSYVPQREAGSPDFSGEPALLVEAAGQLFHLFRDGLDYAFILHRFRNEPDAGRVIQKVF